MNKKSTSWNLKLLYQNHRDPKIDADMTATKKADAAFAKKYRATDFTATPTKLASALVAYEKLGTTPNAAKPWWYFNLTTDLNSADNQAVAGATKLQQRLTAAENLLTFFILTIGQIPTDQQTQFLNHPDLKNYRYFLERIFLTAHYDLPEGEEQLRASLEQTSCEMWIDGQEKLLNQQTITHGRQILPINQALGMLSDLPSKQRTTLHQKINSTLKKISHFAEAEINAVYNYKQVLDERRGYLKPYSATILNYENDEATVMNLVATVTDGLAISHRFYQLHAQLLGQAKITLADRNAKLGQIKQTFDFTTAVQITKTAFARVDPNYSQLLEQFLKHGQIDAQPRLGKKGGAYCWSMVNLPTFVLLNHTDDLRSVETLAHEMGHGIHGQLSKRQPIIYQGHSIATAEVASTFFEQVVAAELENYLSDNEKIILLHNRIKGDISTIFRQIACFNFELELHQKIRAQGYVDKETIAADLAKHLRSYLGPAVQVTDDDGYFFVAWSHLRRFFYVYSYAYGQLISKALFANWQADKNYARQIEKFLSAGRSASPQTIFQQIGIDTANPQFFATGLKSIAEDITRLEKLTLPRK